MGKKLPIDKGSPFDDPSPPESPSAKAARELAEANKRVDRTRKNLPKILKGRGK
jgi:hypothetical protein